MPEKTRKIGKNSPPVEHQFKPGNPGRPKGSRNKLGEEFVAALQRDFLEHGEKVIEAVRVEKPDQYLKVIAQVIPKEVHHTVEDYDDLSDDELEARFLAAAASLGRGGIAGRKAGRAARAQRGEGTLPN